MFTGFPASANAPDRDIRNAVYVEKLRRFPPWAILQAIDSYKGDFAPAENVLRATCETLVDRWSKERREIQKVLTADVVKRKEDLTAEQRKALVAELTRVGARTVADELAAQQPTAAPPPHVDMDDVVISDDLKAILR